MRTAVNSSSLTLTPYETHSRLHTHTHDLERPSSGSNKNSNSNVRGKWLSFLLIFFCFALVFQFQTHKLTNTINRLLCGQQTLRSWPSDRHRQRPLSGVPLRPERNDEVQPARMCPRGSVAAAAQQGGFAVDVEQKSGEMISEMEASERASARIIGKESCKRGASHLEASFECSIIKENYTTLMHQFLHRLFSIPAKLVEQRRVQTRRQVALAFVLIVDQSVQLLANTFAQLADG